MPINRVESIPISEFSQYYVSALEHPLPEKIPREFKLRVSGFPFCGLKAAYKKLIGYKDEPGDAMKDYYCGVGTAAHTVFQRWLGSRGKIYGAWQCTYSKCGHRVEFGYKHKCPKCKREMEYEEFTVTAFRHVSGHIDGVFKDSRGLYWIIDYKTSSTFVIENQRKLKSLPYKKNVAQIEAYVVLLEEKFNIKIEGWMLIYVARDNPKVHKVTGAVVSDKRKHEIYTAIHGYDCQYHRVENLKEWKQVSYLIKHKLCTDRTHYENDIKGFEPCPLESICFGKQLKPTLQIVFDEYAEGNNNGNS